MKRQIRTRNHRRTYQYHGKVWSSILEFEIYQNDLSIVQVHTSHLFTRHSILYFVLIMLFLFTSPKLRKCKKVRTRFLRRFFKVNFQFSGLKWIMLDFKNIFSTLDKNDVKCDAAFSVFFMLVKWNIFSFYGLTLYRNSHYYCFSVSYKHYCKKPWQLSFMKSYIYICEMKIQIPRHNYRLVVTSFMNVQKYQTTHKDQGQTECRICISSRFLIRFLLNFNWSVVSSN